MKKSYRILAVCLASAVLAAGMTAPAEAAAPAVTADEAMYVNLDYYGKTSGINVVKGCSLNGNTQFTDYGSYTNVVNMSDEAKPAVAAGSVTWNLPKNTDRFYYQCTLKNQDVTLPWSFDVSYKLNGVPTDAGKLAGASGMVEIDIKAIPNKNAGDYEKNNMLLTLGTAFKMKDTLSVEAPGAQQQALGDYKAVLFAGLPGEAKDYTIRVGTKSFETVGIVMLMVPGTLDQFKDIKDLKDDKDTVMDSLDAIDGGTDSILNTLEGMTGGLGELQSGLGSADQARAYISANKSGVYRNEDSAVASLSAISKETSALVPHMQQGQQMIRDVNGDVNSLNATLQSTGVNLNALSVHLGTLRDSLNDLRDTLTSLNNRTGDAKDDLADLKTELKDEKDDITNDKAAIQTAANTINSKNEDLREKSTTLKGDLDPLLEQKLLTQITEELSEQLTEKLSKQYPTLTSDQIKAMVDQMVKTDAFQAEVKQYAAPYENDYKATGDSLNDLITTDEHVTTGLSQLSGESTDIIGTSEKLTGELEDYLDALEDGHESADSLLKNSGLTAGDIQSMLGACQTMLTQINTLNNTANKYKDGAVATLKDTEDLSESLSSGLNSSKNFLTSLETLMQTSGDRLDDAAKKSLSGSIDVLQKSMDGIGKTDTVKKAADAIDKAANKEVDKYEKDNNLLNMDAEAKPVSFTSSKNPTPQSIQIIMRTQEISKPDNSKSEELESSGGGGSPLTRIRNIFVKIWNAIKSIFSEQD